MECMVGSSKKPQSVFSESTTKNKSPAQFLAAQSEISIFGSHFHVFSSHKKHISMKNFFLLGPDRKFPVESDFGVNIFLICACASNS